MHTPRQGAGPLRLLAVFVLLILAVSPARADVFNGTLYFTTFLGTNRFYSVNYSYNSGIPAFNLSPIQTIPTSKPIGADGILFAPDGKSVLIGGQGPNIYQVNPNTGAVLQTLNTGGLPAYHLALDPSGNLLYAGGSENGGRGLAVLPTNPLGNGVTRPVTGSDQLITGVAFDAKGNAFYTSSGDAGFGSFGTLTGLPDAPVTHALLSNLPAAHGIAYDPFTGDFILVGEKHVTQVDAAGNIISDRVFSGFDSWFDQISLDGLGHAFIANNDGNLLFIDYSQTGLVGSLDDFTAKRFLATSLDDVAPLIGPGSPGPAVPEPTTLALFGLGTSMVAGWHWRRKTTTQNRLARGA